MTKRQYGFLLLQLFCVIEFIIIDFFMPQHAGLSSFVKYAVIWCAYFIAWPAVSALPICLTLLCDYLLLFTDYIHVGVAVFVGVHLLYCYFHIANVRKKLASLILLALPLAFFLPLFHLYLICLCYIGAFSLHATIILYLQRLEPDKNYQPHLIALVLFAACDIFTALYYLTGFGFLAKLIWLFYAPSQILFGLLMSGNAAIYWQPVHIPAFRRWGRQSKI